MHCPPYRQSDTEVRGALTLRHGSEHDLVRSLAVVDQDEQHIPIGPLGDLFATRLLDAPVDAVYSLYGLSRTCGATEEHALGEPHPLEESLDRGAGQPPREEQPLHSLDRRELSCTTGEEQQDGVRTAPDAPCDRGRQGGMVHALPFDGRRQWRSA